MHVATDHPQGHRWFLAAWLLACPALLAVAVTTLPQLNLYGTSGEGVWLGLLCLLPFAGAIGICRYLRTSWTARVALSIGYVLVAAAITLFGVVYIGCSWAKACF